MQPSSESRRALGTADTPPAFIPTQIPDQMCPAVRICAIGDVVGRPGRDALAKLLPEVRARYSPDLVIVNGENVAGGFGITEKIFRQLTEDWGVDVVTTGNHWFDQKEVWDFSPKTPNLLLPANMYNVSDYRQGFTIRSLAQAQVAVINLTGRLFMKGENSSPFAMVDRILQELPSSVKIRVVDLHAEATSEKQALAHHVAGRVSLVYGTHTHCPTADERILMGFTGFQTDIGMSGGFNSVIGIRTEDSLRTFLAGEKVRYQPSGLDPRLSAVLVDCDAQTGACLAIQRLQLAAS